jgi:hypothetical protein
MLSPISQAVIPSSFKNYQTISRMIVSPVFLALAPNAAQTAQSTHMLGRRQPNQLRLSRSAGLSLEGPAAAVE